MRKKNFNFQNIILELDEKKVFVKDLLKKEPSGKEELIILIHKIVNDLNHSFIFVREVAEEWVKYLILLIKGYGENLINPYSDIENYDISTISENTQNFEKTDLIKILDELPVDALQKADKKGREILDRTLYVIVLGGIDTTFYSGISREDLSDFVKNIYGKDLLQNFQDYNAAEFIPRCFAAKKDKSGSYITNIESMILHSYNSGIRNVAVIANGRTFNPIFNYIQKRFKRLKDLNIVVTAQPLLPVIRKNSNKNGWTISVKNGGYPGGHGHGFKYCLANEKVQNLIRLNNLKFFIFANGDNSVVFNWGANHFIKTIKEKQLLKKEPVYNNLQIAFFLVWEYLRKGGFAFLLTHKNRKNSITQILETELAEKSGADIKQLEKSRGGYNTNVAIGMIKEISDHFTNLPMALKNKTIDGYNTYLFEASLATALTVHQNIDGSCIFGKNVSMNVLGPQNAKYQHWNHISIRKRDDFFAYFSSLFKIKEIDTDYGKFKVIVTERDATKNHPILKGNFIDPNILNTKEFFEIFKDAYIDVDEFYGVLNINLVEGKGKARGKIKFEGNIRFIGSGEISISIPAGQLWLLKDKIIDSKENVFISEDEVKVFSFDSKSN